jgi:two-component system, cell cycle sensor histidine kinase and response regulator CckA
MTLNETLQILLVTDGRSYVQSLSRNLTLGGLIASIKQVDTIKNFQLALEAAQWDAVIAVYRLSREVIEILSLAARQIPLIILYEQGEEDQAFTLNAEEVKDVLSVTHLKRLPYILRRELHLNALQVQATQPSVNISIIDPYSGQLFDESPIPMWVYDPETLQFLAVNNAAIKKYGYQRTEFLNMTLKDILLPEDRPLAIQAAYQQYNNFPQTTDWKLRLKDGVLLDVEISLQLVAYGEKQAFVAFAYDVTEQKQVAESLRRSEIRFRSVIEGFNDVILITDNYQFIRYANAALMRLLGYKISDVLGKPLKAFLHPDEELSVAEKLSALLQTIGSVQTIEHRMRCTDHHWEIVESTGQSLLDPLGHPVLILHIRSISAQKKAEETLRHSEERYRRVVEDQIDLLCRYDANFNITFANPAYCASFDKSAEEILGMNFLERIPETERQQAIAHVKALNASNPMAISEHQSVLPGGTVRWFQWTDRVLLDDAGNIVEYQGVGRDITDQKRLQEELRLTQEQFRQAQKMEAVGRLAGGVAHDFNNLLTVIIGYTDLMLEDLEADTPLHQEVEEIRKVAERATGLTRQLLALSRRQVLEPQLVDLNKVISDTEKMLGRLIGEDIKLTTVQGAGPLKVFADLNQLEQVILNLAVNSRDAMPKGGELILETASVQLDEEYCRLHPEVKPGPYIMLAVSDTGHGMTEEVRSHIFEPFFTTKEKGKGTGLGLSTVYGIVRQSGGHLWVYSEAGIGTTFKLYLPIAAQENIILVAEKPVVQLKTEGHETILLVEDDKVLRDLISRVLRKKGYEVLVASNPEEALELEKGYDKPIHLMLTDMIMPGMDGYQLSKLVLAHRPEIKLLFASGYTENMFFDENNTGAEFNYLQKPFSSTTLTQKVRSILDDLTIRT